MRLTHSNGATVAVPDEKVEHLLRAGFRPVAPAEKPARRATKKADTKSADDDKS